MLTSISDYTTVTGYQGQQVSSSQADTGSTNSAAQTGGAEDSVSISGEAQALQKTYAEKQDQLKAKYASDSDQLAREFEQEKSRLQQEYDRKKQSLGISLVV